MSRGPCREVRLRHSAREQTRRVPLGVNIKCQTRGWHARTAARALHDRAPVQHMRAVPFAPRSLRGACPRPARSLQPCRLTERRHAHRDVVSVKGARVVKEVVVGLALLRGLAPGIAAAEDAPTPPAALERFSEATRLMQHGRYVEASEAYRSVADWPDGGAFPQRAQALFLAGSMLESARDYDGALSVYREAAGRFAGTNFGRKAEDAARGLEQGGPARAIAFRRRLDAAWDELFPAAALVEQKGLAAARPGLERAAELLAGVLRDYPEQPKAKDVAVALGDADMMLHRYARARSDYERAIDLSRREAAKTSPAATDADLDVASALEKLAEAHRAVRREWIDGIAKALLGVIVLGLVVVRPWRHPDGSLIRVSAALVLATAALAGAAGAAAQYVRYVDEASPIETTAAALLVFLPGVTGEVVAVGFAAGLRGALGLEARRWNVGLAAALGALAALAVATCVVHAFALFPFLDSKL